MGHTTTEHHEQITKANRCCEWCRQYYSDENAHAVNTKNWEKYCSPTCEKKDEEYKKQRVETWKRKRF